jgi:hypothetical protein
MLPQRSFFNPLRHKRTTCIVAIVTMLACAAIMARGEGYVELAKTVFNTTCEFIRQLV